MDTELGAAMPIVDILEAVELTLLAEFEELRRSVTHNGDRGENVEELVMEFLRPRLPRAFGVAKGEILYPDGTNSHSIDIIIYDNIYGSVLSTRRTSLVPADSVYGIIEVKSKLSKNELVSTLDKLAKFSRSMPVREVRNELGPLVATAFRASRPFAAILAFQLAGNSLMSLAENIVEYEDDDVFEPLNMIAVLGVGLIGRYIRDPSSNSMIRILTIEDLAKALQHVDESTFPGVNISWQDFGQRTLGQFFIQLLLTLDRMHLGRPNLRAYFPSFEDLVSIETFNE
ncbi:hypothetical protein BH09CHL1_BH09CHL1_19640 [soil metagenome]